MANINFDINGDIIFEKSKDTKTYTYHDVGTKNFKIITNTNNVNTVNTTNTSLYDKSAIKNALFNLFSFVPGEEILDPKFGNSLYKYLYKPISEELSINIKRELRDLISNYEPRINVQSITVETNSDNNLIAIKLYYIIPALKDSDAATIEF